MASSALLLQSASQCGGPASLCLSIPAKSKSFDFGAVGLCQPEYVLGGVICVGRRNGRGGKSDRRLYLAASVTYGSDVFQTFVGLRGDGLRNWSHAWQSNRKETRSFWVSPRCDAGRISQTDFTEMAWQALVASPEVAKENKQQIIETENLMKSLLEQRNG
eukprot:c53660_g1_i1 orf=177-659(+)